MSAEEYRTLRNGGNAECAAYQRVASRLENVRPKGNGLTARCPAHDDKHNSLSISAGTDGRVLLKCFAGCDVKTVVAALGLTMADLFPGRGEGGSSSSTNGATAQQSLTLDQYAEAKKLPAEFLRNLGLTDIFSNGQCAVRIPYLNEAGVEAAVRLRTALEKSEAGDNRFRWRKGTKPMLYGLWRKPRGGDLILCEGESDCHTLWFHGFDAVGVPGATNWNEARDAGHLDDAQRIFVVIEPDKGGAAVLNWLKQSKIRDRAYLLTLRGFKDPSALHLDDAAHFSARLRDAMERAVPVARMLEAQQADERAAAWNCCQQLAASNRVLDDFAVALGGCDVVGEERLVKVLYLALTTRLLDRPVSVAVKGPSSGGKSFIIEQVLRFFPESAHYSLTAMSERALAYTEEDLRHRFLVIFEAAGLAGDFQSYLIRSLLSEGRLIYEFVETTPTGLKSRRMEKEGPTGLLVTTTAPRLHPENETRYLSLTVTDTPEQTQAVLLTAADDSPRRTDFGPWVALQLWLERSEHRVVIPFARELAKNVRPVSVRLRRDFKAVLGLVKAHALLHQATRSRDEEGRVVATVEDYAVARELLADVVSEGVDSTVSVTTRETVRAVRQLLSKGTKPVTVTALASALKLDKGSASRRADEAITRGYLKNLEHRSGRPADLVPGDPLPENTDVLPSVEVLQCCGVEGGGTPPPSRPQTAATETKRIIEVEV